MKHIESIQPEYAAEELERIVREEGDATASAALSRLLHDWTGCAIPPTADTPQSEVEELVPLCLSILRRHWTTPLTALGDGTTPMSLADLMRRLIGDRVQGNEALGIPPANANIPTAVAALTKRHIDDGLTLHPDEALLANKLFIKKIAKYIREGYIVELNELGTLQPGCTSTWKATKEELTKDLVKPKVNYNPSDEVEAAIKGAKLRFVGETDEEDDDQGEGGNGGNNNPDDGMLG